MLIGVNNIAAENADFSADNHEIVIQTSFFEKIWFFVSACAII